MAFEVVLWQMTAPPGKQDDTVARAEAFRADLAARLPYPWRNKTGRVIGAVVGARTVDLTGGTVAVVVRVGLGG